MSGKCPICGLEADLSPKAFRKLRVINQSLKVLKSDTAYHYHRKKDGKWCLSNSVKARQLS